MPRPKSSAPLAEPETNGTDLTKAALETFDEGWADLGLVAKIARISGMLGTIPKRGFNAFHKYYYATEGDVVDAVRRYLAASDIIIIPDVIDERREGDLTIMNVRYTVMDAKGESFSFTMPGSGSDRGDKGVYKASTGSNKYALMRLFKIETGDDPEADTRVDERTVVNESKPAPVVTKGERGNVGRGGHQATTTDLQLRRISETVKTIGMSRADLIDLINAQFPHLAPYVLPEDEGAQQNYIINTIKGLTGEQAGLVLAALEFIARQDEETVAGVGSGTGGY